jgi:hypothetical protein
MQIQYLHRGKNTPAFTRETSSDAIEEHTLSLVTLSTSVDLEAETEADRENLLKCFQTVITNLQHERADHDFEFTA